MSFVKRDTKHI